MNRTPASLRLDGLRRITGFFSLIVPLCYFVSKFYLPIPVLPVSLPYCGLLLMGVPRFLSVILAGIFMLIGIYSIRVSRIAVALSIAYLALYQLIILPLTGTGWGWLESSVVIGLLLLEVFDLIITQLYSEPPREESVVKIRWHR